jgi:plastocyanin
VTRFVSVTTAYALIAAVLVAAPLAASDGQPPAPPGDQAITAAPVEPEADQAAEPVPEPADPGPPAEPAPAAQPEAVVPAPAPEPAAPPPAPPEPAPAETAPAEPAEARDPAPAPKLTVAAAASGSVTISDFEFTPASITVDVGDTVTWSNAGPTAHSATATAGSFDTGIFSEGQSRSHTFDEAGTFSYICTPHPQMKGTVTVQAAAAQGGDDGGSSGDASGSDTGTESDTAPSGTGSTSTSDSAATLPSTGLDADGLLALGVVTLALGVVLRRRAAGTG